MKINPYFYFNGNAAEAITLYEKAFSCKAVVAKYREVSLYDKTYVVPQGMEDYVMHANMKLGNEMMMFCDTPEKANAGQQIQLMISFDSISEVKSVFEVLKDGGIVTMELQKTFWSECFGSLTDKFGVNWLLSYENEKQKSQSYGV